MCYWNIIWIKVNALDLRTTICKVTCNEFTLITVVSLLDTWKNERTKDLCHIIRGFDWYGIRKKVNIFSL